MWRGLVCVPQKNRRHPVCKPDGSGFSVSDCVDYHTALDTAFYSSRSGVQPYFVVSKYDSGGRDCGGDDALDEVEAYSLNGVNGGDGRCHMNRLGTAAWIVTLDHSMLTYTVYSDPYCKEVSRKTRVPWSEIMGNKGTNCVDGTTTIDVRGSGTTDAMAVAVFDERSCSGTPVKLTFTRGFDCIGGFQDLAKSECGRDGSSLYSVSRCTSDDYSAYAMDKFGNYTPYLIMEEWDSYDCKGDPNVTVYTADGSCHSNTDDKTSFKVTLNADSSAEVTTYIDQHCGLMDWNMLVDKRQLLSHTCFGSCRCDNKCGCSVAFSVSGLGGPPSTDAATTLTAVTVYGDDSCTAPASSVRMWRGLVCVPQKNRRHPVCKPDGSGFSVSDCVDYHTALDTAFYSSRSGVQPYFVVSKYDSGGRDCGGDDALDEVEAYSLNGVNGGDGRCHMNRLGTAAWIVTLDHSMLTYTVYSDPYCKEVSRKTRVPWSEIMGNKGTNCVDGTTTIDVRGSGTTDAMAVAVFDERSCSGTPVKLTFTRGFDCIGGFQDLAKSECGRDGSSLYSVSRCTSDDYSAYAMDKFGNYTPYLIMEEWDSYDCKGGSERDSIHCGWLVPLEYRRQDQLQGHAQCG
ncbi:uncharacterized protein IUM83_02967 [Phytophthora cinnamomi]|uniref:uncharacterized protein n=1 Tax=Phytophthora cinnamomi TaxID=4785 RepID=UPI00355A03DD|nr:hypothetical protein IUM83_02967 [Phytophthora cinnamomi]